MQQPHVPGSNPRNRLFDDEEQDIRAEIPRVIKNAGEWLDEPNDRLGGKRPNDLIGTPDEHRLRELMRAVKHGLL